MLAAYISATSAGIVGFICLILVLHPDYEDGLVGRVGLAIISVSCVGWVMRIIDHGFRNPNPVGVFLAVGLAIFFLRHLYRFLRWRRQGDHDWRPAAADKTAGKRAA